LHQYNFFRVRRVLSLIKTYYKVATLPGSTMPKKTASEEFEPEQPPKGFGTLWTLLSRFLSLLSSVVRGGNGHAPPSPSLPIPNKLAWGNAFRRWAADVQEYIELFPVNDRRRVLLSLLDGEPKGIAREVIRAGDPMSTNAFSRPNWKRDMKLNSSEMCYVNTNLACWRILPLFAHPEADLKAPEGFADRSKHGVQDFPKDT
uniref:DDE-1 domain-containing protein n=1 Tax=Echinostoma caproni TaxID=27848 RepID=A0A183B9J7_9TREM